MKNEEYFLQASDIVLGKKVLNEHSYLIDGFTSGPTSVFYYLEGNQLCNKFFSSSYLKSYSFDDILEELQKINSDNFLYLYSINEDTSQQILVRYFSLPMDIKWMIDDRFKRIREDRNKKIDKLLEELK